jgi:hypothetical protein
MHLPTTQGASASGIGVKRQQCFALRAICNLILMLVFLFMNFMDERAWICATNRMRGRVFFKFAFPGEAVRQVQAAK